MCVEFVKTVHAFCNGSPTQPGRTDVKPCMHPSKRVLFKLCCLMNRLTLAYLQYMHDVGHSMAILPPSLMHLFATTSKFFQIAWKIFLCFKIFAFVFGPHFLKLTYCHGDPPVHGIAAHSNVDCGFWLTDSHALVKPVLLVTSLSIVNLITSVFWWTSVTD